MENSFLEILIKPLYAYKSTFNSVFNICLYICCAILLVAVILLLIKLNKSKSNSTKNETITNVENLELLEKIENGFKNNEFKMYLQFLVDNKTKKIASAEALSRWENADGSLIPPMEYIGFMERSGLITKLDYYMFESVCKKLSLWHNTEFADFTISCNFTRITISEMDFIEKIENIANKYAFDRKKLVIEITEDSAEKNLKIAMDNVLKLKKLGFMIALDDIGRGYTSLISMCEYPIDVIKIDRDILLLTKNEKGKQLFSGIIALAHKLGFEVVCEGVETEGQNTFVTESDCNYIQGWYYSKALDEISAENFAREYMLKV